MCKKILAEKQTYQGTILSYNPILTLTHFLQYTKGVLIISCFHHVCFIQLEEEKKKKKSEDPAESKGKGGAASWRWEKQDLEKQLKEAKKKADDLHSELTRQQFKWKMAGDDIAKVSG